MLLLCLVLRSKDSKPKPSLSQVEILKVREAEGTAQSKLSFKIPCHPARPIVNGAFWSICQFCWSAASTAGLSLTTEKTQAELDTFGGCILWISVSIGASPLGRSNCISRCLIDTYRWYINRFGSLYFPQRCHVDRWDSLLDLSWQRWRNREGCLDGSVFGLFESIEKCEVPEYL